MLKKKINRMFIKILATISTMKCTSCGKCCFNLTISLSEFEKLAELDQRISKIARCYGYVYVVWGRCPFLAVTNRCEIYKDRPMGCRAYPIVTIDQASTTADVVIMKRDAQTKQVQLEYGLEDYCPAHLTLDKMDIKRAKVALQYRESLYRKDFVTCHKPKETIAAEYHQYLQALQTNVKIECKIYPLKYYVPD